MSEILQDALNKIKSESFDNHIQVVSGFKNFMKAIENEQVYKTIVEEFNGRNAEKIRESIRQEILNISKEASYTRYMNPNDVALAVLLLATRSDLEFSAASAYAVMSIPNTWYASKVAMMIIEDAAKQDNS